MSENECTPIEKVSIIISKGSLEGVYPGLIMANGAAMEGIEANIFFTFFGLEAILTKKMNKLKVATVGNPAMHMPTLVGAIPGMSAMATMMMKKEIEKLDIPPVGEFIELIHDSGVGLYLCKATVEMFHLSEKDRRKIVKRQMKTKLEIINLKLGGNIEGAQRELIRQLDSYFRLVYSKKRIQAHIRLNKKIPVSMTTNNIILWLFNKKVTYGISNDAIHKLLNNKIKPGEKIIIAKGNEPVPEKLIPEINFRTSDEPGAVLSFPLIVSKNSNLMTLNRIPGKSGLNVSKSFVIPPKGKSDIIIGANVVQKNDLFLATCDGMIDFSDKRVLCVSPVIVIPADLSCDDPAINHDCDVNVHGTVENNVQIKCRKLITNIFNGHVAADGDVTIKKQAANAQIISKGTITMTSILNSTAAGEKKILIRKTKSSGNTSSENVSGSNISCDDHCIIIDSKLNSSTIQARNKIILSKTEVGKDCRLVVGDSLKIISHKTKIKDIKIKIQDCKNEIHDTKEKLQTSFEKLKKSDISAINIEMNAIKKRSPKTKIDMDRIHELERSKRKLERESKKKYEYYGDMFLDMSERISVLTKMENDFEEKKAKLKKNISALYKKEKSIPVIDAREATLSKGLVVKFRYSEWELDEDYKGLVLSEEYNNASQQYEMKRQR